MDILSSLKILLGIHGPTQDATAADLAEASIVDAKLNLIINLCTARLRGLLGGIDPPDELQYIILEVSVVRFNRIGSEGMKSNSVSGESISYRDSDFDPYADEIQAYVDRNKEMDMSGGRAVFI